MAEPGAHERHHGESGDLGGRSSETEHGAVCGGHALQGPGRNFAKLGRRGRSVYRSQHPVGQ